ncbi:class I SAM-dependent methyltransferase [Mycobacterium sp. 23]|uniref:class I SAM-dependent methyltransferase n=1 Tax=Mycobacterium sp. 23 TaxID=3400424 RepID=UPI003AAD60CC
MRTVVKEFAPKSASDLLLILKYQRWRLPFRREYQAAVEGKYGIEIGGPSGVFSTVLPLYEFVGGLDGVNFATDTVWEGRIQEGDNYNYFGNRTGHQYISDATDLSQITSTRYDFLLSSNCLEHVANPVKALLEWKRVIKPGGGFVLVLPNKTSNFDHRRPVTKFDHLLDDYDQGIGEDDLTHLEEILALHDLKMDPPAGDLEQFRQRSLQNLQNRTLHHHVFDADLIEKLLTRLDFDVRDVTTTRTDFFALAVKGLA